MKQSPSMRNAIMEPDWTWSFFCEDGARGITPGEPPVHALRTQIELEGGDPRS
jgi:hypothetical protein